MSVSNLEKVFASIQPTRCRNQYGLNSGLADPRTRVGVANVGLAPSFETPADRGAQKIFTKWRAILWYLSIPLRKTWIEPPQEFRISPSSRDQFFC
ncbi:Uncharacterized protein HZ326_18661 [Fusarium oxysporum f. sp. albedinis]|nr:Protein STB5 [Fusarium oxysporum f. sp. albedinis]KAJ0138378.1 Uncharacterized protein HZ326_18661 [Fusarium oxysporum f. sp. albedinis]